MFMILCGSNNSNPQLLQGSLFTVLILISGILHAHPKVQTCGLQNITTTHITASLRSNYVLNELVARLYGASPSGLCHAVPRWFETQHAPPLFIRTLYLLLYELAFFVYLLVFRARQCRVERGRIVKDDGNLCYEKILYSVLI